MTVKSKVNTIVDVNLISVVWLADTSQFSSCIAQDISEKLKVDKFKLGCIDI